MFKCKSCETCSHARKIGGSSPATRLEPAEYAEYECRLGLPQDGWDYEECAKDCEEYEEEWDWRD
jgi:hypothetical protein